MSVMVVLILPLSHLGAWSELAKTTEDFVALKPLSLSMEDAASIPLAAMTALQALRRYSGDLAGKTVFVPAGCMASHDHPPTLPLLPSIMVKRLTILNGL